MAEKLLKKFAKENFGDGKYIPLLHGRCPSVKPSTLMIKTNRAWWKKPFHHSELIVLSEVEAYVDANCKKFYVDFAESILKKSEKTLQKKEVAEVVKKHNIVLDATENAKLVCQTNCNMGDLELGTIDEEYYEDRDLRDLLHNAILCDEKMKPYKNHKLFVVTAVVYSSMFKIIGKRESSFGIDGEINLKSKLGGWLTKLGSLHGGCSAIKCKAALVSRRKKAPFLFTVSPVEYDEKKKRLKLPDDVFVGKVIPRGRCALGKFEDRIDELIEVTMPEEEKGEEEQLESELLEIANLDAKLEAIERLLMSAKTKEEKERLVVKYLYLLEGLIGGKGQKLYLDDCYNPKMDSEMGFLTELGLCFDGTNLSAPEELLQIVQDYGLILKFISGRSQEELDELNAILNKEEVPNTQEELNKKQEEKQEMVSCFDQGSCNA